MRDVPGPLSGVSLAVPGTDARAWHAARMLCRLGAEVECSARREGAVAVWAASGAMALTGRRDGPALTAGAEVAAAVGGALLAIDVLARESGIEARLPDARVLSERAAIAGFGRDAPRSAGGLFRIYRAADGWLGVNLARAADVEMVPSWLELDTPDIEEVVRERSARELAERGRMLGMPIAAWDGGGDEQWDARRRAVTLTGRAGAPRGPRGALVIDLSALWAGPLCGHLLTALGCRVIKVESVHRPDGARGGPPEFYRLLHAGQEAVGVDFTTESGRARLAALIAAADIVIEASRPRALRQLGIHADEVLAAARDLCWISITAYGRTGPWSNAVGFGDDVALAAGLFGIDPATGTPAPCGDAIADPVTGVNAALVALACRRAGGTWLADLAMREQVSAALDGAPPVANSAPRIGAGSGRGAEKRVPADSPAQEVVSSRIPNVPLAIAQPGVRGPRGIAPGLGADTERVLAELGIP